MRLVAAIILLLVASADAAAQPTCGSREVLLKQLAKEYQEQPVGIGLASNGSVLELLTSTTGTWTLMVTPPQGPSCLLGTGEAWTAITPKTPAEMAERGT